MSDWQILGSNLIHQNSFMRLLEYDVIRPNGRRAPYYVLERYDTSIIIPITESNETYLVGQYRYPLSVYSWEFPMGAYQNKDPLLVAKKELKEEVGLRAEEWVRIGDFKVANGYSTEQAYVYMAKKLRLGKASPEPGELFQVRKLPLRSVGNMIAKGEIKDAPTICAYHFLEVYLGKSRI